MLLNPDNFGLTGEVTRRGNGIGISDVVIVDMGSAATAMSVTDIEALDLDIIWVGYIIDTDMNDTTSDSIVAWANQSGSGFVMSTSDRDDFDEVSAKLGYPTLNFITRNNIMYAPASTNSFMNAITGFGTISGDINLGGDFGGSDFSSTGGTNLAFTSYTSNRPTIKVFEDFMIMGDINAWENSQVDASSGIPTTQADRFKMKLWSYAISQVGL